MFLKYYLYIITYMFVFHVMDNILKNISYNMTTVCGRTLLIIVVIKMYFLVAFQSLFSYFTKKKFFSGIVEALFLNQERVL